MGLCFPRLRSPVRVSWATYPRNFLASYLVSMVSRVLWSPKGLVEVRVSWPRHPRYKKKKKHKTCVTRDNTIHCLDIKPSLTFGIRLEFCVEKRNSLSSNIKQYCFESLRIKFFFLFLFKFSFDVCIYNYHVN